MRSVSNRGASGLAALVASTLVLSPVAPVGALVRSPVAPTGGHGTPLPSQIRIHPRSSAPTAVPALGQVRPSTDPRSLAVAGKLREGMAQLRARAAQSAQAAEQGQALQQLRGRATGEVKVRFRSRARTPRFLRARKLERTTGAMAPARGQELAAARGFLRSNRALLLLDDPDRELAHTRTQRDHLGRTHLRFAQRYRGLEVWPAELIVHFGPGGEVDLMNGVFVGTPRGLGTEPAVTPELAMALARERVPDGASAPATSPELIVYAPGDSPARLAWRTTVSVSLSSRWLVVVDAENEEILTAFNRVATDGVQGSGLDLLGATQPLELWSEGGRFYLTDTSKTMYDATSDPPEPETTRGAIIIKDAANQPPTSEPQSIPPTVVASSSQSTSGFVEDAVSAAANFSSVYDYFWTTHGRNSLDGDGGSILAIVRLGQNFANAFFSSELNLMGFGDAEPYAAALDVVGHELAHGVTANTSNLVYQNQPGALNEAMSDIFGEMVEAYANGTNDWLLGSIFAAPMRSMQDPSSIEIQAGLPYPEKMSEYIETSQDNGGVHLNSSIINYAYYQLAAGLPGAIGIADAERIFYRANTVHLTANSQFIDARLACVQAAEELFLEGSAQARKTGEAFDFVEIFDADPTPDPPPFPGTSGVDSTLFLFYDPYGVDCNLSGGGGICLGREDFSLGDDVGGIPFSLYYVSEARPSVVGDGSFAAFLRDLDICLADTSIPDDEICIDLPGVGVYVNSVALSPHGDLVGFVLLDDSFYPDNFINIFDLDTELITEYELQAPTLDGGDIANVIAADVMNFTVHSGALIYDAYNEIQGGDGGSFGVWSIYELDIATGTTFAIVPPVPGLDIGNPSLAQTSDHHLTFETWDQSTDESSVWAANLDTGDMSLIGTSMFVAVPSYTGDDGSIVYTLDDASAGLSTNSGGSLVVQDVETDRITPTGDLELWLEDAAYGVVYRRGAFDTTPLGECEDGIDNDGDELTDFPDDPGCESADDPLEVPEPAAALLQLAALAILALLRRRR